MIWLTLIICLENTAVCRERQDFDPFALPMTCALAAQQAAAEWLRAHPAYRLREARCEPDGRRQSRA